MDVEIYIKKNCPFCAQTLEFLIDRGVNFTEYDISCDPIKAQEMVLLTNQTGVPVIKFPNEIIVGFDLDRLQEKINALRKIA